MDNLEQYVANSYLKTLNEVGSVELKGTDNDIMGALDAMARVNLQRPGAAIAQYVQQIKQAHLQQRAAHATRGMW